MEVLNWKEEMKVYCPGMGGASCSRFRRGRDLMKVLGKRSQSVTEISSKTNYFQLPGGHKILSSCKKCLVASGPFKKQNKTKQMKQIKAESGRRGRSLGTFSVALKKRGLKTITWTMGSNDRAETNALKRLWMTCQILPNSPVFSVFYPLIQMMRLRSRHGKSGRQRENTQSFRPWPCLWLVVASGASQIRFCLLKVFT